MRKVICKTIADMGCVTVNGICFPVGNGDGIKHVVYTDERNSNLKSPFIDLRNGDVEIWFSDCCKSNGVYRLKKEDVGGCDLVCIDVNDYDNELLLIKE